MNVGKLIKPVGIAVCETLPIMLFILSPENLILRKTWLKINNFLANTLFSQWATMSIFRRKAANVGWCL